MSPKYEKLQIISVNTDTGKNYYDACYPLVGPISIGNHVKKMLSDIEVDIVDEGLISRRDENIEDILCGENSLVGFNVNTLNYQSSLRLARIAKMRGATTIMGGPHATSVGDLVLKNRDYIDFAVRLDGEQAVLDLINHKKLDSIPGLVYRNQSGEVQSNLPQVQNLIFEESYGANLDLIVNDLSDYWKNHKMCFPDLPERAAVAFTHLGCKWRQLTQGCSFCAISQDYSETTPVKFWSTVNSLKERYGIESIRDSGDDVIADRKFLSSIVDSRPKHLRDIVFEHCYISPRNVDEKGEVVTLLKRLNVSRVFMGLESGDDSVLRGINKGATARTNYRAAKILSDSGIEVMANFIVGLKGETNETLQKTTDLAQKVSMLSNVVGTNCSVAMALAGSRMSRELSDRCPEELEGDDVYSIDRLRDVWIREFCHFDDCNDPLDFLKKKAYEIIDFGKTKFYFGLDAQD